MIRKQTINERGQLCLRDWGRRRRQHFKLQAALLPPILVMVFLASGLSLEGSEAKPQSEVLGGYLWLQLCDTSGLHSFVLDELALEVSRLYPPPAPRILWYAGCSLPSRQAPPQLRVVIVKRLPHGLRLRHKVFRKSAPIAWYGRNQMSSVIYVSSDAVVDMIGGSQLPLETLARALGRVAAHEIGHHFFGSRHTRHGLMKRELSRYDLMSPMAEDLKLTREQLESMHAFVQDVFPAEATVVSKGDGSPDQTGEGDSPPRGQPPWPNR